ncbi:MAG TPA: HET-C-related protein [Candidatus Elarobacter sp.]
MRSLVVAAFVVAYSLVTAAPALAFDTGPHAGITEDSLRRAGFNRPAADAVQVENWLTDYYTSTPTIGSGPKCDLDKLHFDDVFSNADIAAYWTTLAANTKAAAQQAERDNDVVEFYTVLGMSLHVVQDYYTHSNWVEQNGASGPYKTTTWFETTSPPAGLFTGWYPNCLNIPLGSHVPHGGYTSGLNHDSVVRPRYDRAYVYALAASYEWTQNVLGWVSGGFAARVKSYNPSSSDAADLAYDQKASIYVSEWIENPVNPGSLDGHWNGNRSGYAAAFAAFAAAWTGAHNSVYVRTFKQKAVYAALSRGLYQPATVTMPAFTPYPTSGTVFAMRTLSVNANFSVGNESYFGSLVATNAGSGYPYRDASQYHRPRTEVPWLQLILVPANTPPIAFEYSLWNEYLTTHNDLVPIQGGKKTLSFRCSPSAATCSGDIAGGPWSAGSPYSTKGSGFSGVELKLYFTSTPAAP